MTAPPAETRENHHCWWQALSPRAARHEGDYWAALVMIGLLFTMFVMRPTSDLGLAILMALNWWVRGPRGPTVGREMLPRDRPWPFDYLTVGEAVRATWFMWVYLAGLFVAALVATVRNHL